MKLLILDNHDSFTYNLVQAFSALGAEVLVRFSDEITIPEIEKLNPDRLVISPGPYDPERAGISVAAIREFAGRIPILGVCLGHQAIGVAFGGLVVKAPEVRHGKASAIEHDGAGVFSGLPNAFPATRYHSLVIDRNSLPKQLRVTAWTDDHAIMAVQHESLPVFGVQFHPESILTKVGPQLLENFLNCCHPEP